MTYVVCLISAGGASLDADHVAAARAVLRRLGAPPGEAVRLDPNRACELPVPRPVPADRLREALHGAPVDVAVLPAAGRRKRLLVADMDATIVEGETLDELAAEAGVEERVAPITARAMNGEIDFPTALRERVALLEGLCAAALERTWSRIRLTAGARELVRTMRAHGARTILVSGGFRFFTSRVAALVGFDEERANDLLLAGGRLTGRVAEPILGREAKLATLCEMAAALGLSPADAIAVGDGANDLPMLQAAGLGVAFRAKPIVAASAPVRIDQADLAALLYLQGYRRTEFVC